MTNNTKTHSRSYYIIRSTVRWIVWGGGATAAILLADGIGRNWQ